MVIGKAFIVVKELVDKLRIIFKIELIVRLVMTFQLKHLWFFFGIKFAFPYPQPFHKSAALEFVGGCHWSASFFF